VLQLINRFISAGVAKQGSPAGAAAAAQARLRSLAVLELLVATALCIRGPLNCCKRQEQHVAKELSRATLERRTPTAASGSGYGRAGRAAPRPPRAARQGGRWPPTSRCPSTSTRYWTPSGWSGARSEHASSTRAPRQPSGRRSLAWARAGTRTCRTPFGSPSRCARWAPPPGSLARAGRPCSHGGRAAPLSARPCGGVRAALWSHKQPVYRAQLHGNRPRCSCVASRRGIQGRPSSPPSLARPLTLAARQLSGVDLEPSVLVTAAADPATGRVAFTGDRACLGDPELDKRFRLSLSADLHARGARGAGRSGPCVRASAARPRTRRRRGTARRMRGRASGAVRAGARRGSCGVRLAPAPQARSTETRCASECLSSAATGRCS